MSSVNRYVRHFLYVFVAVVLAKFIGSFTSFFVAKYLSPAEYGTWISLMLIVSYSPIVCFGTIEALVKQYPYYIGKRDFTRAREVEEGVLGSVILSGAILLLAGISLLAIVWSGKVSADLMMVGIVVMSASVTFLSAFFYHRFTAHQNFKLLSIVNTTRAISSFCFLVSCSWAWGLRGAMIGYLASEMLVCVISYYLSFKMCGRIGISFNPKLLTTLVKIGFPISIVWWIFIIQSSADRLISITFLGAAATGFYGLGGALISAILLLPQALGSILYPRVNEKMGANPDPQSIVSLTLMPVRMLSFVLPIALGMLVMVSPVLYQDILPKYSKGLLAGQILIMGSFFLCLINIGANFLIAVNKEKRLLAFALISLTANVSLNSFFAKSGGGIEGIALGSGFCGALLTTLILQEVFRGLGYSLADTFKQIAVLYFPFMLLVMFLGCCYVFNTDVLIHPNLSTIWLYMVFVILFVGAGFVVTPMQKSAKELYSTITCKLSYKPSL